MAATQRWTWTWLAAVARSPNAEKRDAERFLLMFTPVWMASAAVVMVGGLAGRWGDAELLAFGAVMHLAVFVGLVWYRPSSPRGTPVTQRLGFHLHAWIALFAYLANAYSTKYFYEVLGMSYGFNVTLFWNNVPFFLCPLTVAYFGTYYALITASLRIMREALVNAPALVSGLCYLAVTHAVAFLETALNANPFIQDLFCYEDLPFMIWFGTLMYGSWFALLGRLWLNMGERPGSQPSWAFTLGSFVIGFALTFAASEVYAGFVAPYFTTARPGRIGLFHVGESCLRPR